MEAYQEIRVKFPDADSFMYGRGVIARPYLLDEIMRTGGNEENFNRQETYKQKMRQFHDRIYCDYQEYLSGERNVLFRMKRTVELHGSRIYKLRKISEKDQKVSAFRRL